MLDEPPNFFNPFIQNTGDNNVYYNPYYTNDHNKINLTLNKYLVSRFIETNFLFKNKEPYFFSKKENDSFIGNNFLQIFLPFSTILNFFLYYKLRKRLILLLTLPNIFLFRFTMNNNKLIIFNSYVRNFNGYSDEEIDYIITCNENIIKSKI
jgi:hypothetical protein